MGPLTTCTALQGSGNPPENSHLLDAHGCHMKTLFETWVKVPSRTGVILLEQGAQKYKAEIQGSL